MQVQDQKEDGSLEDDVPVVPRSPFEDMKVSLIDGARAKSNSRYSLPCCDVIVYPQHKAVKLEACFLGMQLRVHLCVMCILAGMSVSQVSVGFCSADRTLHVTYAPDAKATFNWLWQLSSFNGLMCNLYLCIQAVRDTQEQQRAAEQGAADHVGEPGGQ